MQVNKCQNAAVAYKKHIKCLIMNTETCVKTCIQARSHSFTLSCMHERTHMPHAHTHTHNDAHTHTTTDATYTHTSNTCTSHTHTPHTHTYTQTHTNLRLLQIIHILFNKAIRLPVQPLFVSPFPMGNWWNNRLHSESALR